MLGCGHVAPVFAPLVTLPPYLCQVSRCLPLKKRPVMTLGLWRFSKITYPLTDLLLNPSCEMKGYLCKAVPEIGTFWRAWGHACFFFFECGEDEWKAILESIPNVRMVGFGVTFIFGSLSVCPTFLSPRSNSCTVRKPAWCGDCSCHNEHGRPSDMHIFSLQSPCSGPTCGRYSAGTSCSASMACATSPQTWAVAGLGCAAPSMNTRWSATCTRSWLTVAGSGT